MSGATLCRCDAAAARAVSPDHCACGNVLFRESAEPPLRAETDEDIAARPASSYSVSVAGEELILAGVRAGRHAERARADRAEREAHRLEQQVTQLMVELAEKREAHRQDHEALAAFQRASGCPDGVTLAVVLREHNALVRDLRDVGTATTPHLYRGGCPDMERGDGEARRDDDCEACHVLTRADAALVGSHGGDA